MCQNSHFPIFNHARGWLSNFNHARGWEMTMRQKLTMCVVEFLAHFHVRVRECARTGTFLLLRGGRKRAEDGLSEEGREYGKKGERETSREVVYSQTNHSQTGPCP